MGTNNFAYKNRCLVLENENTHIKDILDFMDYSLSSQPFGIGYWSDPIKTTKYERNLGGKLCNFVVVYTNGYYDSGCLDYLCCADYWASEDAYADDSCFEELYSSTSGYGNNKAKDRAKGTVSLIAYAMAPMKRAKFYEYLEKYDSAVADIGFNDEMSYSEALEAGKPLDPLIKEIFRESWRADERLANEILDSIAEDYNFKELSATVL